MFNKKRVYMEKLIASILQTEQAFKLGAQSLLHFYFLSCGPGILGVWYLEEINCIFSIENTLSNYLYINFLYILHGYEMGSLKLRK